MIQLGKIDTLLVPPDPAERFAALCAEVATAPQSPALPLERPALDQPLTLAPHVRLLRVDLADRALRRAVSRGHSVPGPAIDDYYVVLYRQDDQARWHLLPAEPWTLLQTLAPGRALGEAVQEVHTHARNPLVFQATWKTWVGLFGQKGILTAA